MRLPWPDTALLFFAMFLWGAAPFSLWQLRETWRWWQQRASFTGRLRALAFTATLVPLVLLGNVLPAQWVREREQAQAELARTLASAVAQGFWQESLESLVRDLGATVAVYRPSFLAITSRPDLAALGSIPLMPPAEAYVRAIRRWLEPLVVSGPSFGVFIPAGSSGEPLVIAVMGLTQVVGSRFHPGEWFAITGLWASILALWAAEGLARRLTGPMAQLVEAARLLGKGEPAPLESLSQGQDEFATLAQAFAAMAEKVQSRQRELQRQRDLFQRVLENLSAAVVLLEGEQAVLANDAAKRLGLAGGLAALEEVFGPAVRAAVAKAAAGSPRNLQLAPRGQADALWNIAAIPLVGEGGGVLVVLEDLSELARAERLASLTELARIVAHEVKNPLTPIRLWMEELQAALSKDPQKVAEVARLAVEETLQQVDRLKEVSQGFSNLVALEQWEAQEVDAVQLAGEVVEEYRVLERRGVAIQLLAGCSQLLVRVDPAWLARALRHLLENSARALGGRGGSITVQVDKEGDWGVVAVRDSAGGVAEEHLVRLFEPHFSTTSEGSGLGLAVVRRVCQKAGGRAEARNLAEGLEVRMLLPAI
jgi:signal transduction histidine kinase